MRIYMRKVTVSKPQDCGKSGSKCNAALFSDHVSLKKSQSDDLNFTFKF